MEVEEVYIEDNGLGKIVEEWANSFSVQKVTMCEVRSNFDPDLVDGIVVLHANHDMSKHHVELLDIFEKRQKGISKIDVDGTLSVAKSSFDLWLDRNHPKKILVVGESVVAKNVNIHRFLSEMILK